MASINFLDEDFLEELKSYSCQDRSQLPRFTHKLNVFRLCNDEVYGLKPAPGMPIIPVTYDLAPPIADSDTYIEFVNRLYRSIGDEYKPLSYIGVLRIRYGSLTISNHILLQGVSSDLISDNWGIYDGDLSYPLNLYQKYNKFVDIIVGANYQPAITQSADLIGWARLQTDIK